MLQMQADLNQMSAALGSSGNRSTLTDMELMLLCNVAKLGLHALAVNTSPDPSVQDANRESFSKHAERLRTFFAFCCRGNTGLEPIDFVGWATASLITSSSHAELILTDDAMTGLAEGGVS